MNLADLNKDTLLSVGIDIGTTTTHLVVTSLKFSNVARPTQINALQVTDKEVLFESTVYRTPLTEAGLIDAKAVAMLIEQAYAEAEAKTGRNMKAVQTGAVIITGESARTRNAAQVLEEIAELAGEFVVESAGPNLESILCARGSGAQALSKAESMRVLNIDIGGGTSNFAVIDNGAITSTAVNFLAGRAIIFDQGKIAAISRAAQDLCREKNINLTISMCESECQAQLSLLAAEMAEAICTSADNYSDNNLDLIVISGGVAEIMATLSLYKDFPSAPEKNVEHIVGDNPYNDFGIYLARALTTRLERSDKPYSLAANAIRATVLGAGMHTLQLSGSTIEFAQESLPLRNLPLLKIDAKDSTKLVANIKQALAHKELDWSKTPLTLALTGLDAAGLQYQNMKSLAQELARAHCDLKGCEPLVVTTAEDIGMALGSLLKRLIPDKRIITVDGIAIEDGDYLDIGRPLHSNSSSDQYTAALPVVVKTLIFYKN